MVPDVVQVSCARCHNHCNDDVVKVTGKYYHLNCFTCCVPGCNSNLIQDGYFGFHDEIYCRNDYHRLKGARCARCNLYVEGVAISALNDVYHPNCFACFHCNTILKPKVDVCYDGVEISCENCNKEPETLLESLENLSISQPAVQFDTLNGSILSDDMNAVDDEEVSRINYRRLAQCASCGDEIGDCQSLMALEKPWHLRCFTCHKCGKLLAEEYIGKDGIPYCEQDYQTEFGVMCAGCNDYITGKVLQAGGKHYHPMCSRCGKCGGLFGEGEEMYLRGDEIWHPACSEETELIEVMNESGYTIGNESGYTEPDENNNSLYVPDKMTRMNKEESATNFTNGVHLNASTEHKYNIWKPPYQTSQSIPIKKPPGFPEHLVKRENPVKRIDTSADFETDSEDDIPPVPPPPKRTSSKIWKHRYSSRKISKPSAITQPSTTKNITNPGSLFSNPSKDMAAHYYDSLTIDTSTHHTINNSFDLNGGVSPNEAALIQKGIGMNMLQYRRSLRESQRKTGNI